MDGTGKWGIIKKEPENCARLTGQCPEISRKRVYIMAFFDKLGNTISAAGKDGISKAREWADTAKISVDIKEREGAIQKMYRELGKAYYHDHKEDEAPAYDQIAAIRAAFEEIGELKANKDEIRGIRRCPECGQMIARDANFCSNCGAKCEKTEKVEGEVVDSSEADGAEEVESEVVEEAAEETEKTAGETPEDTAEADKEQD